MLFNVRTILISNIKIVESATIDNTITQIYGHSLSYLDTGNQ
jgi:hypothetical protein